MPETPDKEKRCPRATYCSMEGFGESETVSAAPLIDFELAMPELY